MATRSRSGSLAALEARLRHVEAQIEIRSLLGRLARAVDRRDREMILSCFHPEGTDNHGAFMGSAPEFANAVVEGQFTPVGKRPTTSHHVGNSVVEVDGETAYAETYFIAQARTEVDGKAFTLLLGGRYLDRFVVHDGKWKIRQRIVLDDWRRYDEVTRTPPKNVLSGHYAPDDLVYRLRDLPERYP